MPEIISGLSTQFNQFTKDKISVIAGVVENNTGIEFDVAIISELITPGGNIEEMTRDTIDAVIAYLQNSHEKNAPELLHQAVSYANTAINEKYSHAAHFCTLAIAIIVDGQKLFIANVGHSRIFLVRGGKLSLLTLDHTFKNVMPIQERLSPESALTDPRAERVVLAIGENSSITVDIGLHLQGHLTKKEYLQAQSRGTIGLPLKPGDSILVCSNDFINTAYDDKESHISAEEVATILSKHSGDAALNEMIDLALTNNAMLQPAAAILQVPEESQLMNRVLGGRRIFSPLRAGGMFAALVTGCLFLSLAAAGIGLFLTRDQLNLPFGPQSPTVVAEAEAVPTESESPTKPLPTALDGEDEEQLTTIPSLTPSLTVEPEATPTAEETVTPAASETILVLVEDETGTPVTEAEVEEEAVIETVTPEANEPTPEPATETPMATEVEATATDVATTPPTASPSPTIVIEPETETATPAATETPVETTIAVATETATAEPSPTLTAIPSATATAEPPTATAIVTSDEPVIVAINGNINMRGGPGTNYDIIAIVRNGAEFAVTHTSEFGNWYFGEVLESGDVGWIWAAFASAESPELIDAVPTKVDIPSPPPPPPPPSTTTTPSNTPPTSSSSGSNSGEPNTPIPGDR